MKRKKDRNTERIGERGKEREGDKEQRETETQIERKAKGQKEKKKLQNSIGITVLFYLKNLTKNGSFVQFTFVLYETKLSSRNNLIKLHSFFFLFLFLLDFGPG
jgi:hypothetical protein